ncbi:hypothetical protein [Streptomyces sp. YPW6]|uniref:hypothetical protein n=1 Tax=Streptomyces sp. YPW6 TaxID=2840373 RepID=UPI003D74E28F
MKGAVFSPRRQKVAGTFVAVGAAVAMAATTVGTAHADEGGHNVIPEASITADGQFFKPGPNTIVKQNVASADTLNTLKQDSSGVSSAPPGPQAFYTLKQVKKVGQVCGTNVIQQTSGHGKATLVLTVDKRVDATVKREIGIDLGMVSAGMGWDVTRSYGVSNQTRFEVPRGKFGTIQAYPLYDNYIGHAYHNDFSPTGKYVRAYKPVGVCFNQWVE